MKADPQLNHPAAVRKPKPNLQSLLPWLASALSGLLLVAVFPKFHWPGLVWVACAPLLAALSVETRLKGAFLLGYVCGACFFAGSCYWFVLVMEFYGHLASALAVLVLILFVIVDSVFLGGFGLAMGYAARRSPGWALAASPFLWMAMELCRTYLITGFPWNLLGYGVQASGVRQIASVTGVYGLSFLAVATSALLAWLLLVVGVPRLWKRPPPSAAFRNWRWPAVALACWVVPLLLAQGLLAPPPVVEGKHLAILIQPNVPLDDEEMEHWVPWRDPAELNRLVEFSVDAVRKYAPAGVAGPNAETPRGASTPPLLIWAENPAPFFFTRDPVFRGTMENLARQTHTIVIANTIIPLDANGDEITNSAFTLSPAGNEISRYDKIHLVPFGEYVPWWALPGLVHKITSEVGNFVPGTSYSVAPSPSGGIGVFICYEAIIPQLARKLVANGAGVLVNISNDGWYGDSAAPYQHLEMARLRAIENHRYLLRATNNGVTSVIDPYGRVLQRLPRYQRLALPAHFDFEARRTFYTAHGDLFAWLCAVLGVLMLAIAGFGPRTRAGVKGES